MNSNQNQGMSEVNELVNEVANQLAPKEEPQELEKLTEEVEDEETTPTEEPSQEDPKKSNPIRDLRNQVKIKADENSKMQKLLERVARDMGVSVDKLEEVLQEKEIKKNAQMKGIPEEVQAELTKQQNELEALRKFALNENFNKRISSLQEMYPTLKEGTRLEEFAKKVHTSLGVNIYTPDLDLVSLYRAVYFDTVASQISASEREKVLNELQEQKEKAPSIPKVGGSKQSSASTEFNPKNIIDDVLKQFKK